MPFQMQIPEIFSYVGMKDTKYRVKCLLCLPKDTKWKKELKLNTILPLKRCINFLFIIYLLIFHFAFTCTFTFNTKVHLISKKYFSYLSTINITYFKYFTLVIF